MKNLLYTEILLLIVGIILLVKAYYLKSDKHPWNTGKSWVMIFNLRRKDWYLKSGYLLHILGLLFVYLGLLCGLIYFWQ